MQGTELDGFIFIGVPPKNTVNSISNVERRNQEGLFKNYCYEIGEITLRYTLFGNLDSSGFGCMDQNWRVID